MQIYYSDLQAIERQTMQLGLARCSHCRQEHQLVSHGFIHKKRVGGAPEAVGKRVFCSNRYQRTGCGRTMQLYLAATVRYLHHAGGAVVAFVLSLGAGMSIQRAYAHATGTATPRHAYRWLDLLCAQLGTYRTLAQRPPLQEDGPGAAPERPTRLRLLMATFEILLQRFEQPLCAAYQLRTQGPLL